MRDSFFVRKRRRLETILRKLRRLSANSQHPGGERKRDVYSVGIYAGRAPYDLHDTTNVKNPVLTGHDVNDVSASYIADPFMLRNAEGWQMFFEVLNSDTEQGEIGLATSRDRLSWRYEKIVLRENHHLSYPYVFWWNGEGYMIPESYQARSVRLYKAVSYPDQWVFVKVLIDGGEFVDSSPFHYADRWWMFVGAGGPPYRADMLRLFYADDLLGHWSEHPDSPIITGDTRIARPAGRAVVADGRVFRFAQNCSQCYGESVRAFEITELTVTRYVEEEVCADPVLLGTGRGWNAAGMHHADPHRLDDGRWIACVDGWRWVTPSLLHRLKWTVALLAARLIGHGLIARDRLRTLSSVVASAKGTTKRSE